MKTLVVNKNDAGQRLDKFISKAIPNLPSSLFYKYVRTKRIQLNSKRTEFSARLKEGDEIQLYISDEFFREGEEKHDFLHAPDRLDIIYEDENLLLLDKKAGVLCHPDDKEYIDTLIARVKKYLYKKGEYNPSDENSFTPSLVNRIDRNTGGIVIAAKNAPALKELNLQMKKRNLKKSYLCIVQGIMKKKTAVMTGYLSKDEDKNLVSIKKTPSPGAKEIATEYRVLKEDPIKNLSLLEVNLLTGRTHQIRAHFALIGHPLLGDGKYGSNKLNKKHGLKKQCLYSYKLAFYPDEDSPMLSYLYGKVFEAEKVWFAEEFERI